jgi:serine/threonine protein phosphatase PrpC
VASRTRKGVLPHKPGKINQDSFFILKNFAQILDSWYLGVCDGHGTNGHHASQLVKVEQPSKSFGLNMKKV